VGMGCSWALDFVRFDCSPYSDRKSGSRNLSKDRLAWMFDDG
jgi:hypothetical protein